MKKILLVTAAVLLSAALTAQNFSISNTIGGNQDTLEGQDLLAGNQFALADRLQADVDTKYFEGRGRFDIFNVTFDGTKPELLFRGYAKAGIPYISAVFGNSFFSKFQIKAAEVYALDTVPNYGKIIKNGAGLYSEIPFNKKNKLKLGTAVEFDSIIGIDSFAMDFGFDYIMKNRFSVGGSFRDVTSGQFGKYSVLAGTNFGDFRLNAGYIYNNTDIVMLPSEAKHSIHVDFEYSNKSLGIKAGSVIVSALTPEYLRGGKGKTDYYADDAIPFMAAFSFDYSFDGPKLDLGLKLNYSNMLRAYNSCHFIIYPNVNYKFCNKMLELNGGVKLDCNNVTTVNKVDFSLPVSLKFTWQTK